MKKIFNSFFYIAAFAAALLTACVPQETDEKHEPGAPDVSGCYGVYFPKQDAAGAHTYDPTQTPEIEFKMVRKVKEGAISVPVTVTASEDGIFVVPATIDFPADKDTVDFKVTFDAAKMGVEYKLHIAAEDPQYVSMYNAEKPYIDFSVLRVEWKDFMDETGKNIANFTFTQGWWGEVRTGHVKYYEVDGVRTCVTITDPTKPYYYSSTDANEYSGFWGKDHFNTLNNNEELTFYWYINEKNNDGKSIVQVPRSPVYVNSSYGEIVYALEYYYGRSKDYDSWLDWAKDGNLDNVSYYDNGEFYLNFYRYYMYGVGGWAPDPFDVVLTADGYTRVDYSMEFEADYPANGIQPIYVTTGKDVKTIKYAVYEGEFTTAQTNAKAEEIAADKDAATFTALAYDEDDKVNYGLLEIALPKSGTYTLIAVAYDADNKLKGELASLKFDFIGKDDEADNAVEIVVGTEEIAQRYQDAGYSPINSLAYFIQGKNVTAANVAVVKTASYEKAPEAYAELVKSGAKGVTVLDADAIKRLNSGDAYATVVGGEKSPLSPLTSYTVIVWATNGKLDVVKTAEHTTDGLPMEDVATGTYAYKVAFASWGSDTGIKLVYDPNTKDYIIQNIFYYVDFHFVMDAEGVIHFDAQDTGATYQDIPIYVLESHDYYTDAVIANPAAEINEEEAADIRKNSYYDKDNGVYYFNMAFVVPNVGSFGHGWETFTVDPATPAEAPAFVSRPSVPGPSFGDFGTKVNIIENSMVIEHNRQPVQVTVNEVAGARMEKKAVDHNALTL